MYDYLIDGELSENIQLRDQDIVIVPPRKSFVTVDSAVVKLEFTNQSQVKLLSKY